MLSRRRESPQQKMQLAQQKKTPTATNKKPSIDLQRTQTTALCWGVLGRLPCVVAGVYLALMWPEVCILCSFCFTLIETIWLIAVEQKYTVDLETFLWKNPFFLFRILITLAVKDRKHQTFCVYKLHGTVSAESVATRTYRHFAAKTKIENPKKKHWAKIFGRTFSFLCCC